MTGPEYYSESLKKPLHPLFRVMEPHLPARGIAYDLGSGTGNGTLFLSDRGFHVIAVDNDRDAIRILQKRLEEGADVRLIEGRLEELQLIASDVIIAMFSLFFLGPEAFPRLWKEVLHSLKPGGVFAGQILGVNDDWANLGYSLHTRHEVENELFADFDILHLEEVDRDGKDIFGVPKHWHIFHIVAKRKA
jgi:tellurite methyltransferase